MLSRPLDVTEANLLSSVICVPVLELSASIREPEPVRLTVPARAVMEALLISSMIEAPLTL